MIEIIQGTPGSGKSAVALLTGLNHLMSGGVLACNFDLVPDWSERLAKNNIYVRMGLKSLQDTAHSYYNRCFKVGSVETLYELGKHVSSLTIKNVKKQREGQALLILDEAQLYFNSRDWQKNFQFIEFFSQHRKLNFNVLLVAHSIEMIDKQVRPFIELSSVYRNLKNVRIPVIGLPLSPYPVFLVVRRYAGLGAGKGVRHSVDTFVLDKTSRSLYDSMAVFAFDDLPDKLTHQGNYPFTSQSKSPKFPKKKPIDVKIKTNSSRSTYPASTWPCYHERIVPEGRYVPKGQIQSPSLRELR